MGLTDAEKSLLAKLNKKAEEPDAPPVGRTINANIDLGDPKQVALAVKHGFLTADEVEELTEGDGEEKEDSDETPIRQGYFGGRK